MSTTGQAIVHYEWHERILDEAYRHMLQDNAPWAIRILRDIKRYDLATLCATDSKTALSVLVLWAR